jgi:hypothetical protein
MLYFFNLAGSVYDPDVVGIELPSLGDARVLAAKHAGELIRDRPGLVWGGEELRVEVTDANRLVLFTSLFSAWMHLPAWERSSLVWLLNVADGGLLSPLAARKRTFRCRPSPPWRLCASV